jgi:hypothetical protein
MKRKTIARKHHYLPQAYLAAFTDNGSKKARFYVLNLETGKCFRTSPQNVAAIRDFNRVDMDGHPPDVLEQALSNGEQRMSEACRKVDSLRTFPSDEDYSYILNLICLLAVRDPQRRKTLNRAREQTTRIIESMLVSDPKIYEHHLKKAIEAGKLSQKEACAVSFEDLKQFVGEGEYEIKFLPEGNIKIEFNAFNKLLPILHERMWSVLVAPDPGPCFICSDRPVSLRWRKGGAGPVGFALRNTEVFFPLTPRTGFYGVYEKSLPPVFSLNPKLIAMLNWRMVESAKSYVFSPCEKFSISHKGELVEIDCKQILIESGSDGSRR